jgi:hypothetical protein
MSRPVGPHHRLLIETGERWGRTGTATIPLVERARAGAETPPRRVGDGISAILIVTGYCGF